MSEKQTGDRPVQDGLHYYLKPEERVDLTNCDREPIHIINHVQPHGALLALNPNDLTILQASANTRAVFGLDAEVLAGQNIDSLLAPERVKELKSSMAEGHLDANPLYLFTVPLAGQGSFHIIAHTYQAVLIVEAEPGTPGDFPPDYYGLIKKTLTRFEKAVTVQEFAQIVCEEIRRISGFDRVLVYKFLEDDCGHVIAEDLAPEEQGRRELFLGLRYPASDIPKQARALYTLNALRLIQDIGYVPAPLLPAVNSLTGHPLDLSLSFLRGVSAMHLEYLRNMGVQASMSLAIVKDGVLWGLVACHHHTPRRVAYDVRTACEFLSRVVSLQVADKEMNEQAEYQRRIEASHHSLLENMARKRALMPALTDSDPNILTFVDCSGAAVLLGKECRLFGEAPTPTQVRALAEWLEAEHPEEVYATHTLLAEYDEARACKTTACGVLALRIAYGGGGYILWFRPEVIQTVNWGGDPTKLRDAAATGDQLMPRHSFALWQETVHDTALAWKPVEIEAARRLRVSVIEAMARMAEELAQSNEKLVRSNVELDAFAYIASHDLKEPLRGIHNFSHFLKEDYGSLLPDEGKDYLETVLKLTRRMEALIDSLLYYSRVGRLEFVFQECDLNLLVKEVLEALHLRIEETAADIRIPSSLPRVRCDRVQIGEVFHNLIQNALKYNDKQAKWVEIGSVDAPPGDAEQVVLNVRDNGIGIEANQQEAIFRIFKRLHGRDEYGGGSGAGLTIARKIVERHNGLLWVESVPDVGSTFYFTLPKG